MRRLSLVIGIIAVLSVSLLSCSSKKQQEKNDNGGDKAIVCYFSATGTTEKAAKRLSEITGAPLLKIEPQELYSDADLDWRDTLSRSYVEMHNRSFRPILKDSVSDLSDYSIVFIGYPNWWNTHPTIINSFIEANNLEGKTIVPFMTSGGSNIINSEKVLRESYPSLNFARGLLMNNVTDNDIANWLKEIGL